MPLPFIPVAIGLASVIAGGFGAKKAYDAYQDNDSAKALNEEAKHVGEAATQRLKAYCDGCEKSLENLGNKKVFILTNEIEELQKTIEDIELKNDEIALDGKKFHVDKREWKELKAMCNFATSMVGGATAGLASGALTAFGAYGAAGLIASASTGTAISTLSGIAATNATLAFFGGGSLAAGGLGVLGGATVLGGIVAGPALAIMGAVLSSKASALKDEAWANLEKAETFEAETKTVCIACDGIRRRANMFFRLLVRSGALATVFHDKLCVIVDKYRNPITGKAKAVDFNDEEYALLAKSVTTLQLVKRILNVPLLTEKGELTSESERVAEEEQEKLDRISA